MAPDHIRQSIRSFLAEAVMYRRPAPLSDSDSLIKAGLLDSLAMLSLISFLEQTFELSISDDEVEPDNFGSIDRLTAFVSSKLGGAQIQVA